ncbi:acyl-CoA dehydrogenase [Thermodesulfobacteriota bacterium]
MTNKFVSERNLKFLIYEVFDTESLTKHPYYEDYDRKMLDMVIKSAMELAEGVLWPNFQEMDKNPPELVGDQVKVHPSVKTYMRECGKGGWIASTIPEDMGGQQLPHLIGGSCRFVFAAANFSSSIFTGLTTGAAHLIISFGSKELFDTYVPKIHSGEWQGTMALTESEAGSSLADITTTAVPTDNGYYNIRGQKIFISAGDHDAVENVVHLMLARIEGAPPGVKGLSLFVVPKKRIGEDGNLVSNDVVTSGIFHKLGSAGCPTAQLSIGDKGDCRGYLVGEPNNGLRYMFQMMNEARMGVGLAATAIAMAAYYSSLEYCKIRKQGRKITEKDPTQPQIPIIQHPDIKRMLLFQRSIAEGSLSLLMQCYKYMDMQTICGEDEKEIYDLLLEILTPVVKAYPSEMGILSVSQGLQCLGGSGYCDDYPLEQYYRDQRINAIYEGTTGIQGLDLLGRKVVMNDGRALSLFIKEVEETMSLATDIETLVPYAERLKQAIEKLQTVTSHLIQFGDNGEYGKFLADSTLYLEFFSIITIAWQWLSQGIAVQRALLTKPEHFEVEFYQGKMYSLKYFFHYELPKIEGLFMRLMEADGLTDEIEEGLFND